MRTMHDSAPEDIDAPLDVETTRDWKSQGEACSRPALTSTSRVLSEARPVTLNSSAGVLNPWSDFCADASIAEAQLALDNCLQMA